MAKRRYRKELQGPIEAAVEAGWTLDYTSEGHPRLTPPRGTLDHDGTLMRVVTFNGTGGNSRRKGGDNNSFAVLKRAGVTWGSDRKRNKRAEAEAEQPEGDNEGEGGQK